MVLLYTVSAVCFLFSFFFNLLSPDMFFSNQLLYLVLIQYCFLHAALLVRGWSRALIWASVEVFQVNDPPEVPPWFALKGKVFKIVDNSRQIVPTFSSKCWQKLKRSRVLWEFFVLFTVFLCSDAIFNLQERVADGSFSFLCKMLIFLFLPFLNLGAQISWP